MGNKKRVLLLKELSDVKTVGIVYDASSEELYKRAAHLVRHFSSMRKEVQSIAITNTVELPPYVDNAIFFPNRSSKEFITC